MIYYVLSNIYKVYIMMWLRRYMLYLLYMLYMLWHLLYGTESHLCNLFKLFLTPSHPVSSPGHSMRNILGKLKFQLLEYTIPPPPPPHPPPPPPPKIPKLTHYPQTHHHPITFTGVTRPECQRHKLS